MKKIIIDLSTINCGICYEEDGKFITYTIVLWDNDYQKRIEKIRQLNFHYYEQIKLYVELANFKNASLTSRFNRLLGDIEGLWNGKIAKVIVFNANVWHPHIGIRNTDIREICKIKGRLYAYHRSQNWKYINHSPNTMTLHGDLLWKIKTYRELFNERNNGYEGRIKYEDYCKELYSWYKNTQWEVSDDESDALCMMYVVDKLKDQQVIREETKARKQSIAKEKIKKLRDNGYKMKKLLHISNELNKYLGIDRTTLKKAQVKKIERLEKEYNELNGSEN